MEYSLYTYIDVGLFFYSLYLVKLLISSAGTYWRWIHSTYWDPDIEYLRANPEILYTLQNILHDVYPGYLMSDEEKEKSFWAGLRWPILLPLTTFCLALSFDHYEVCILIALILSLKVTLFWQGIHCITEDTLDRVQLILGE